MSPRVFVLVSLSGLLSQLDAKSRENLTATFDKCDASLGAAFVVSDSASAISTLAFEPWLKRHLSNGDGIWLGDGFADQFVLQATKTTTEMYGAVDDEFGYVLVRGRARLLKLLITQDAALGGGYDE